MNTKDIVLGRQEKENIFELYSQYLHSVIHGVYTFNELLLNKDLKEEIISLSNKFITNHEYSSLYQKTTITEFAQSQFAVLGVYGYKGIQRKNGSQYLTHILYCIFYVIASKEDINLKHCIDTAILHDIIEEGVLYKLKKEEKDTLGIFSSEEIPAFDVVSNTKESVAFFLKNNLYDHVKKIIYLMEVPISPPEYVMSNVDKKYYFEYLNLLNLVIRSNDEAVILTQIFDRLDAFLNVDYIIENKSLSFEQKRRSLKRVFARSIGVRHILSGNFSKYKKAYHFFDECCQEMCMLHIIQDFNLSLEEVEVFAQETFCTFYQNSQIVDEFKITRYLKEIGIV